MENTIDTGAMKVTPDQRARQPRPLVLALLLTSILCLGVKPSITNNTKIAVSDFSQEKVLSEAVTNAVVQDLSKRSGLPESELTIVDAQQLTWSDRCLGVNESENFCTIAQVPGWQITVTSGKKRWVYRTNASGSVIKLNHRTATPKQNLQGFALATNSQLLGNG